MMTLEDAQKWCSSDISKGVLHGTRWAYFYTSAYNFLIEKDSAYNRDIYTLDLRKAFDNSRWDDKIAALGIVKYNQRDIKEILGKIGVNVLL